MGDVRLDSLDHGPVVLDHRVEERGVTALLEEGEQSPQRLAHVAGEPQVDRRPTSEVQRLVVDLDDRLPGRQEGVVREVRAEHEQRVGLHNRVVAGGKADQAGQSHIIGVVVLDMFPSA